MTRGRGAGGTKEEGKKAGHETCPETHLLTQVVSKPENQMITIII